MKKNYSTYAKIFYSHLLPVPSPILFFSLTINFTQQILVYTTYVSATILVF